MNTNKYADSKLSTFTLSLKDIAAWQIPMLQSPAPIYARPPSLQRGSVWEPSQIELLWDSIFRGFPIGSLVVVKKIEGQFDKLSVTHINGDTDLHSTTTHHILDGQQRCNAIAWGFVDPDINGNKKDEILWLDLLPKKEHLKNSTRNYLFRMTTKAHPWGFDCGDEAKQLSVSNRNLFLDRLEKWKEEKITKRPEPKEVFPFVATFPVPVFLLFKYFDGNHLNWSAFWDDKWVVRISTWSEKSVANFDTTSKNNIEEGLKKATESKLIALSVPDGVGGIENVEKIFQRLNGQGTPLNKEEIAYSMIKAYWPAVEKIISEIKLQPIHDARLVSMGLRVALTNLGKPLSVIPEVQWIREIFNKDDALQYLKYKSERTDIEKYIMSGPKGTLTGGIKWIDDNLLYSKNRIYGIPAYLRSSIAWSSPEVFAWLMLIAKNDPKFNEEELKKLIGLVLSIHWFATDKDEIVKQLSKLDTCEIFNKSLATFKNNKGEQVVLTPLSPENLREAFQLNEKSTPDQLNKWTSFWQGVVGHDVNGTENPPEKVDDRIKKYGLFIEKLRQLHEILIYAQRDYISSSFEGFDPANKLMWKGYNRPWDYDHILPSAKLNATGSYTKESLQFHEACKAWQGSIGNLVAVDFTFNRSVQDNKTPLEKYSQAGKATNGNHTNLNVFASDDLLEKFNLTLADLENKKPMGPALEFVLATQDRFIEMYQDWYQSLGISQLTQHD